MSLQPALLKPSLRPLPQTKSLGLATRRPASRPRLSEGRHETGASPRIASARSWRNARRTDRGDGLAPLYHARCPYGTAQGRLCGVFGSSSDTKRGEDRRTAPDWARQSRDWSCKRIRKPTVSPPRNIRKRAPKSKRTPRARGERLQRAVTDSAQTRDARKDGRSGDESERVPSPGVVARERLKHSDRGCREAS